MVLGDKRLDQLLAVRLEALERAAFVAFDQARVADHVSVQDRRQPPLRPGHRRQTTQIECKFLAAIRFLTFGTGPQIPFSIENTCG